MTDALTPDELKLLQEAFLDDLEPVTPPPAVRGRLLDRVRSTTIRADEGSWRTFACPGIRSKKLRADEARGTVTLLLELAPGAVLPAHDHGGMEDTFVVSGSCRIGSISVSAGDFHHVDAGAHHGAVVSDAGCMLLLTVDAADYDAA